MVAPYPHHVGSPRGGRAVQPLPSDAVRVMGMVLETDSSNTYRNTAAGGCAATALGKSSFVGAHDIDTSTSPMLHAGGATVWPGGRAESSISAHHAPSPAPSSSPDSAGHKPPTHRLWLSKLWTPPLQPNRGCFGVGSMAPGPFSCITSEYRPRASGTPPTAIAAAAALGYQHPSTETPNVVSAHIQPKDRISIRAPPATSNPGHASGARKTATGVACEPAVSSPATPPSFARSSRVGPTPISPPCAASGSCDVAARAPAGRGAGSGDPSAASGAKLALASSSSTPHPSPVLKKGVTTPPVPSARGTNGGRASSSRKPAAGAGAGPASGDPRGALGAPSAPASSSSAPHPSPVHKKGVTTPPRQPMHAVRHCDRRCP